MSMTRAQDGLTCCDEARADGRGDFVAFVAAVQRELDQAWQRAQGDAVVLRQLVTEVFNRFDAAGKAPAASAPPLHVQPSAEAQGRKFKFSSSRATLRVKTTVELLLEEQREAAAAATVVGAAAAAAPAPKPKSRIMFSN